MQSILLAVDGSEHSDRAAHLAAELSRAFGAYVDVIHVVQERVILPAGAIHEYGRLENLYLTEKDVLESVGKTVEEGSARIVREGGGKIRHEGVVVGIPAYEIVAAAKKQDVDCIVMGRRGLGDIKGLFLGSVSHKVAHLSDKTLITTE
ncbi:MAG: universal stress protein [Acidimicrobiia bacterium]